MQWYWLFVLYYLAVFPDARSGTCYTDKPKPGHDQQPGADAVKQHGYIKLERFIRGNLL
jgi:hypothetical protein